jgi:hypothetical protein
MTCNDQLFGAIRGVRKRTAPVMATAALAAGMLAAPALAGDTGRPGGVEVGILSCHEASGWGFIFGSSRELRCTFSQGKDTASNYTGSVSRFGVDIGYQQAGVIVWAVFAPTQEVGQGALAGHYGGVTAGASVGVGGSANVLIGGSERAITLQPVSIEGATGVNAAAGIAEISLHPAAGR